MNSIIPFLFSKNLLVGSTSQLFVVQGPTNPKSSTDIIYAIMYRKHLNTPNDCLKLCDIVVAIYVLL